MDFTEDCDLAGHKGVYVPLIACQFLCLKKRLRDSATEIKLCNVRLGVIVLFINNSDCYKLKKI